MVDGPVIRKGTNGEDGYSGFTMQNPETMETIPTRLAELLRDRRIERIVVVGLATDYCVKATALDGKTAGFNVALMTDAVRSVDLTPGTVSGRWPRSRQLAWFWSEPLEQSPIGAAPALRRWRWQG